MVITLHGRRIELIGEVKPCSPSGFISKHAWEYLFNLANKSAFVDRIAIHIDARWGGSLPLLKKARSLTDKPILAKAYTPTDEDIRGAISRGADKVLVVGRIPNNLLADNVYFEPITIKQIQNMPAMPESYRIQTIVWNSRDLANLSRETKKTETIEQARQFWPRPKKLIQASNIKSLKDIHPEADAVLVGSYLPEFLASLEG